MPERTRVAVFGGVYSNHLALAAALRDVRRRGVDAVYCLGDLGAFGPHPDRVFPLLHEHGVQCLQGNYDNSIGHELPDCQCGYTDPRDNHFARLSYAYTLANTSPANRAWLRGLPMQRRLDLGHYRLLLCHGSPRKRNEFLWESTTPNSLASCDVAMMMAAAFVKPLTTGCERKFTTMPSRRSPSASCTTPTSSARSTA